MGAPHTKYRLVCPCDSHALHLCTHGAHERLVAVCFDCRETFAVDFVAMETARDNMAAYAVFSPFHVNDASLRATLKHRCCRGEREPRELPDAPSSPHVNYNLLELTAFDFWAPTVTERSEANTDFDKLSWRVVDLHATRTLALISVCATPEAGFCISVK